MNLRRNLFGRVVALCLPLLPGLASAQSSATTPAVYGTWETEPNGGVRAAVQIGPCPDKQLGPVCGWIVDLVGVVHRSDGKPIDKRDAVDTCPSRHGEKIISSGAYHYFLLQGYQLDDHGRALEGGTIFDKNACKTVHGVRLTMRSGGRLQVGPEVPFLTHYWTAEPAAATALSQPSRH